jgi:hypothetical protein
MNHVDPMIYNILDHLLKTYDRAELSGYLAASNSSGGPSPIDLVCVAHPFKQVVHVRDLPRVATEAPRRVRTDCSASFNMRADIVFHTHPEHCYIHHRTWLGIPSRADIIQSVYNYKKYGHKVNIIAALEGFYILELRRAARGYIHEHGADYFAGVLSDMYDKLNYSNYKFLDVEAQLDTIRRLIDLLNQTEIMNATFKAAA